MLKIFKKHNLRKIFSVLFAAAYIYFYPSPVEVYELGFLPDADIYFYTCEKPGFPGNYTVTDIGTLGGFYEVKTDKKNAEYIRGHIGAVSQTAVFYGDSGYVLKYLNIRNMKMSEIEGGLSYTGYSGAVKGRVIKGNINIQIYCKDGLVYIGSPFISGSF